MQRGQGQGFAGAVMTHRPDMAAAGALGFRAMTSAFWDRDLQSDTMRWNDGMERLFGAPLASLPPDGMHLTVMRSVGGCAVSTMVRQNVQGYGRFARPR